MPGFVADASATLPWRFDDEATPWTETLLDRVESGEEVVVPAHWPLEVVNGLLMARRRGRVFAEQVSEFVEDLSRFPFASNRRAVRRNGRPFSRWPSSID